MKKLALLALCAGIVAGCDDEQDTVANEPIRIGWIDDQTMRQGSERSITVHIARQVRAPVRVWMEGLPQGVVWANPMAFDGGAEALECTLAAAPDAKPVTRKEVRVVAMGLSGERAEGSFLLTVERDRALVSE